MDLENIKSWVSQPDVCRCCLSSNGSWDLLASYVNEFGDREVFCEILKNCFGISISHVSEWGPSRLICSLCVEHLRDASKFKTQVMQAEEYFTIYLGKKDILHADDGQIKPDSERKTSSPCNYLDGNCYDNETNLQMKSHIKRKRKKHKNREIIRDKTDSDSDTPISELSRVKQIEDTSAFLGVKEIEPVDNVGLESRIHIISVPQLTKTPMKQVSERKRIRLTCDIVLRNTTACPFRHHKSWFQCFYCTQDFMEINQLRLHTLESHANIDDELRKMKRFPRSLQIDITKLDCVICDLYLINIENMCLHFLEKHNKIVYKECIADYKVNASPYTCHLCSKQFHVFRTLTTHLNEHYANCICDVCGKSFLNTKRLKIHKRTHENGTFPCLECGKVLKTRISKANHMESAHSKRVIKCQICFKPMKHYNDRIKHMSEEHNITHKFKCPICAREYNIKHYLATHMRQTHGHKNKKCNECGMAFITNHGLKKHMQKHSGVKAFTCEVCNKSYARSYTLKEHVLRAHDGEPRFLNIV